MPRYKLIVAYDGTAFHGWQKQCAPGAEPMRTVQGVLEEVVRGVVREPVDLVGASRTDAGVHARGQVAAFTTDTAIPVTRVARALNGRLPGDVRVLRVTRAASDFDPISDATSKGYRFRIAHAKEPGATRPLFDRHQITFVPYDLDPGRMGRAAAMLVGTHDFSSFTRVTHGRDNTVRTVLDCTVTAVSRHRVRLDVSGTGFLYNMVRIMAGTLVEIGRGHREPEAIADILAARNRAAAGSTLPPEGLCLMWIRYH